MSQCKSCGADIEWIKTDKGKWMPLDLEPFLLSEAEPGDFVRCVASGMWIKVKEEINYDIGRPVEVQVSHFSTCPDRDKHRKNG